MNRALELFGAFPRRHNCAQAVACGLGEEDFYDDLASCGGGKAPGGLCGAVYAAQLCVPEDLRAGLEKEFGDIAGAVTCAKLKQELHVPCPECVRLAAELAERYRGKNG